MFHCFCHVSGPILSPGDISSTCAPPGPRFVLHHISSSVSVALKLVKVIDNADGVENNPCCGPGSKLFCRIHIIRMVCKKKVKEVLSIFIFVNKDFFLQVKKFLCVFLKVHSEVKKVFLFLPV